MIPRRMDFDVSKRLAHRTRIVLLVFLPGACRARRADDRPPIVQPGAPGQSSRAITAGEAADLSASSTPPRT
jgi:hypothetical protein